METNEMTAELQAALPDIPEPLKRVLKDNWDAIADRITERDASPINDLTIPLANMAAEAGFHQNDKGKEFIQAAMAAAGVPEDLRVTVSTTFAVQLLAAGRMKGEIK